MELIGLGPKASSSCLSKADCEGGVMRSCCGKGVLCSCLRGGEPLRGGSSSGLIKFGELLRGGGEPSRSCKLVKLESGSAGNGEGPRSSGRGGSCWGAGAQGRAFASCGGGAPCFGSGLDGAGASGFGFCFWWPWSSGHAFDGTSSLHSPPTLLGNIQHTSASCASL